MIGGGGAGAPEADVEDDVIFAGTGAQNPCTVDAFRLRVFQ